MAYEPTEWECGDVVTAEKLNKIENGIANADGGGGFDFVLQGTQSQVAPYETEAEILSGDFDTIYNKIINHEYVNGAFYLPYDYGDAGIAEMYVPIYYTAYENAGGREMVMIFSRTIYFSDSTIMTYSYECRWIEGTGINLVTPHTATIVSAQ